MRFVEDHTRRYGGIQAIAAVAAGSFDIVLMDCQMPDCNGYTATRAIRAQAAAGSKLVPIIAQTANAFTEDREHCFEAGMDDILVKPYTRETLKAILLRWAGP